MTDDEKIVREIMMPVWQLAQMAAGDEVMAHVYESEAIVYLRAVLAQGYNLTRGPQGDSNQQGKEHGTSE